MWEVDSNAFLLSSSSSPKQPTFFLPSPLPCSLIGKETLGKIAGISFHRSPRLSTRVMRCLFGIMHSRRGRSPQTPRLPPLRISRSASEICALSKPASHAVARRCVQQPACDADIFRYVCAHECIHTCNSSTDAPTHPRKLPHAAAMQVTQGD